MTALSSTTLRRNVAAVAAAVLVMGLAGTALAGAGYGGAIQIGLNNLASTYQTNLIANAASRTALAITNNATTGTSRALYALSKSSSATAIYAQNTSGSALQLVTPADRPPMVVSSAERVTNLNAARAGLADNAAALDGTAASGYQRRVTGTCDATHKIRAINADGSVTCAADADAIDGGDAETLDGLDSTDLIRSRRLVSESTPLDATPVKTATATCPVETVVLAGGFTADGEEGSAPSIVVEASWADTDTSWHVRARNGTSTSWSLTVQAICVQA